MEGKPLMPRKAFKSPSMVGETFVSYFPEIARRAIRSNKIHMKFDE